MDANWTTTRANALEVTKGQVDKANQATVFLVPTGREVISPASMFFMMSEDSSGDIPGGDGLNLGSGGNPPSASYPQ